jgi:hypothetical protein
MSRFDRQAARAAEQLVLSPRQIKPASGGFRRFHAFTSAEECRGIAAEGSQDGSTKRQLGCLRNRNPHRRCLDEWPRTLAFHAATALQGLMTKECRAQSRLLTLARTAMARSAGRNRCPDNK